MTYEISCCSSSGAACRLQAHQIAGKRGNPLKTDGGEHLHLRVKGGEMTTSVQLRFGVERGPGHADLRPRTLGLDKTEQRVRCQALTPITLKMVDQLPSKRPKQGNVFVLSVQAFSCADESKALSAQVRLGPFEVFNNMTTAMNAGFSSVIKRESWTEQEDHLIREGKRRRLSFAKISEELPSRTAKAVSHRWERVLRKKAEAEAAEAEAAETTDEDCPDDESMINTDDPGEETETDELQEQWRNARASACGWSETNDDMLD